MTQFNNIRIPSDTVLDPLLVPLLDKLALDKPKWIFKAKPTNKHGRHRYNDPVFEGDKLTANIKYTREVDVFENDEELGTLGVDWAHRRGVAQRYVWTVESWRIDRQRGSANTKTSMKMDIIVREAKKIFKPKGLTELMATAKPRISSAWYSAVREFTAPFERLQGIKSSTDLQLYAFCLANNRGVDMTKFTHLLKQLRSPEFETMIANYELGRQMEDHVTNDNVLDVVIHDGMFVVAEPNNDVPRRMTYEEMPTPWQERIAVLQLVSDGELVRDTGYKVHETWYRIIK
jgi:hypothetical protein